ncbi:rod shape-determining protein MreC [Wenzhouxiangella sp. XN24]|uniref:rod shape-determining protein MreC n=1 Tax=Wenzhouxiangella sp. XN24 TaxID=2713569 RepID=UPI003211D892
MNPINQAENKPLFDRGPSLGTRMVLLAFLSVCLIYLDYQQGHLQTVRRALSVAVYPIRVLVDMPSATFGWARERLAERDRLVTENRELRLESLRQQARLQQLIALEVENARLRSLMESPARLANRVQVAEILAVDLDPYRHRIALNRGEQAGVYEGQALLDADGIVGQVIRVNPLGAEAILISDPSHATPVELSRNGLRTVALGVGDVTRMDLPFLPNSADIQVGDLLTSSGLGDAFPAGYPVARVTRVERRPGEPFAHVEAEPTAALNRTRQVLLVWKGGEQVALP